MVEKVGEGVAVSVTEVEASVRVEVALGVVVELVGVALEE